MKIDRLPCMGEICGILAFSEIAKYTSDCWFVYTQVTKTGVFRGENPLCRWVSNRGVSIPVGTRFCLQSLVCYTFVIPLLPADAGKGLASPSAVWADSGRQTLFSVSRTGGFCDTKVTRMQDF